jgi:predicted nucleic acid-binding protein
MPAQPTDTDADAPIVLVDTSIAVPLAVSDHEAHEIVAAALDGLRLGLCGHAAFETYSVLTRLPAPLRLRPRTAATLLTTTFPESRYLPAEAAATVVEELADIGIAGGAVFDALVALTAQAHGLDLVTADGRALRTYRALGVEPTVVRF